MSHGRMAGAARTNAPLSGDVLFEPAAPSPGPPDLHTLGSCVAVQHAGYCHGTAVRPGWEARRWAPQGRPSLPGPVPASRVTSACRQPRNSEATARGRRWQSRAGGCSLTAVPRSRRGGANPGGTPGRAGTAGGAGCAGLCWGMPGAPAPWARSGEVPHTCGHPAPGTWPVERTVLSTRPRTDAVQRAHRAQHPAPHHGSAPALPPLCARPRTTCFSSSTLESQPLPAPFSPRRRASGASTKRGAGVELRGSCAAGGNRALLISWTLKRVWPRGQNP